MKCSFQEILFVGIIQSTRGGSGQGGFEAGTGDPRVVDNLLERDPLEGVHVQQSPDQVLHFIRKVQKLSDFLQVVVAGDAKGHAHLLVLRVEGQLPREPKD